jgi:hypothetical protein
MTAYPEDPMTSPAPRVWSAAVSARDRQAVLRAPVERLGSVE